MALVVKDRVKVYSSTTGTGTLSLGSAFAGFQTFNNALGDGDTTYYGIFESSTGNWEVGLGTYTSSGNTLSRDTILESSNAGAAVNLTADTEVFITYPAEKSVYFDANGDVNLTRDPQSALQAATKQYVDTIAAAGIHYHDPVRVESPDTAGSLNATYNNGSSGVGATLTNAGTQAALVIDGVTVATNDRVLIYNQTNAYENGVYTVTNTGSASTNWVLTRATDADSYGPSDPDSFGQGDAFFVKEGDTGAGELYVMNTAGEIVFGTTAINFIVVAETAVYSAGTGLSLSGTEFNVGAGTGITVDATTVSTVQDIATSATPTFAGLNTTADITFGDNDKAIFGAGSDLSIYSDGANSIIQESDGTGNLLIRASNINLQNSGATATLAQFIDGGKSSLRYNGSEKLATTSTGIDVTGDIDTSGSVTLDANNYINWNDGSTDAAYIRYYNDTTASNADRLDFYHSSTSSGTAGYVQFYANGTSRVIIDSDETWNTERYTTDVGYRISAYRAAAGIPAPTVYLDITQTTFDAPDNFKILLGTGDDLELYHDATNSIINNKTGDLQIQTSGSTKLTVNSTGIDVTGTVTADGLTVDGGTGNYGIEIEARTDFTGISGQLAITDSTGSAIFNTVSGSLNISTGATFGTNTGTQRLQIGSGGDISFYEDTGTTAKFFWDASAERLGIGTTSPSSHLHVKSTSDNIVATRVSTNSVDALFQSIESAGLAQVGTVGSHAFTFFTANQERMRIDSSGNVGIGTTQQAHKLSLEQSNKIGWVSTVGTDKAAIEFSGTDDSLRFYNNTGSTERMRIDSSGNVGIGTSSPSRNLYVSGGSGARADVQVSYDALGTTANDGAQFGIQSGGAYLWNFENSDTYFAANNTVSLRLKSGGYALFERSGKSLYVNANYSGLNTFAQIAPPNTDGMDLSLAAQDTREEDIYIKNSTGYVGIGESNPDTQLHVQGVITAGDGQSTSGTSVLEANYVDHTDDNPNVLGTQYSNSAWDIGYGVRPKSGAAGYVSSIDNGSWPRGVLEIKDDISFKKASAQTTAVGSDVSLTEVFKIDSTGDLFLTPIDTSAQAYFGSATQTNYMNLVLYSNSGNVQMFKNGTGYTSYGGASSFNIYNSNANIAFFSSGRTAADVNISGGNLTVADSAQFESGNIRIGDGFGTGGSATIHRLGDLYLQYNNGQTTTNLYLGGGGTTCDLNTQGGDITLGSGLISQSSISNSSWPYLFGTSTASNTNSSGFWVGSNGYPDMRLRRNDGTVRALISSWEESYVSNGFRADQLKVTSASGYFFNDTSTRTAFTGGDFYIQSIGNYYNYATNQYHGASSGDNHYFRGNTLSGDSWSLTGAGAFTAASLDISGSVAIGAEVILQESTDRADLLQITSTTSSWAGLQIRNSSNEGRWSFMTDGANAGIYDDENNKWHLYLTENGRTQLRYNAGTKLETTSGGVAVTGALTATGDITAYFSDERLKDFDGKIEGALDKVSQLNGYYYRENDKAKELGFENDDRQVGVSAQEVEAVLPEVIKPAPVDPEYKTVQYEKLVPLLIEAIKELKEEVRQLKEDKA